MYDTYSLQSWAHILIVIQFSLKLLFLHNLTFSSCNISNPSQTLLFPFISITWWHSKNCLQSQNTFAINWANFIRIFNFLSLCPPPLQRYHLLTQPCNKETLLKPLLQMSMKHTDQPNGERLWKISTLKRSFNWVTLTQIPSNRWNLTYTSIG